MVNTHLDTSSLFAVHHHRTKDKRNYQKQQISFQELQGSFLELRKFNDDVIRGNSGQSAIFAGWDGDYKRRERAYKKLMGDYEEKIEDYK